MQVYRRCALLIFLAAACTIISAFDFTASAQSRFAVETSKRPTFSLSDVGMKLAPELRPAVETNTPFIGLTPKGDPVLEFPPSTQLQLAKDMLANAKLAATQLSSDTGVVEIKRLLVFMTNPSALPEGSIGQLPIVRRNADGGYVVVETSSQITPENLKELAASPSVRYVEPDFTFSLNQNVTPNDPEYTAGKLWGLKSINAPAAWAKSTRSKIVVGVLDSGVDYSHKDLSGNMWDGPNKTHGYNYVNDNTDPKDRLGHGTHVAGIIGAVGNNGEGVVGVNWSVSIMALQVFGSDGSFSGADNVVRAIDFAIANKVRILNASWNGPNFAQSLKEAINRAQAAGLLIVAAAGNEYGNNNDAVPTYPASYANPNIIAVLSIDQDEKLSSFSNFGKKSVQLGAPGGGIDSSLPGNRYGLKSGTSMAAPYVSGAAALVWSMPDFEKYSAIEVKTFLLDNARPLVALKNRDATGGTLDLSFVGKTALASASDKKAATITGTLSLRPETTGTDELHVFIRTEHDTVKLDLSPEMEGFQKTLKELAGEPVTITGTTTICPEGRILEVSPQ